MRGTDYEGTPPPSSSSGGQSGERRVALVIGNGAYKHTTPLKNPANDAASMARALTALGFDVVGGAENGVDLGYGEFAQRVRDFARRLRDNVTTALIFYAGHGMQIGGRNYLVPIDASLEYEADVGSELFELQHILNQMERPKRTSIVLLDACRNNPLARNLAKVMGFGDTRSAAVSEGLAEQKVSAGTLIAYATQPGHVAYDGATDNGYFTEALLSYMATPDREIEVMMKDVRSQVISATERMRFGPQVPWSHSSLVGTFYFQPTSTGQAATETVQPTQGTGDLLAWSRAEWAKLENSNDVSQLESFSQHCHPYYVGEARSRIADLEERARRTATEAEAKAKLKSPGLLALEKADTEGRILTFGEFQRAFTSPLQTKEAEQQYRKAGREPLTRLTIALDAATGALAWVTYLSGVLALMYLLYLWKGAPLSRDSVTAIFFSALFGMYLLGWLWVRKGRRKYQHATSHSERLLAARTLVRSAGFAWVHSVICFDGTSLKEAMLRGAKVSDTGPNKPPFLTRLHNNFCLPFVVGRSLRDDHL